MSHQDPNDLRRFPILFVLVFSYFELFFFDFAILSQVQVLTHIDIVTKVIQCRVTETLHAHYDTLNSGNSRVPKIDVTMRVSFEEYQKFRRLMDSCETGIRP